MTTYTPDLAAEVAEDLSPAFSAGLEAQFAAALLAPLVPMVDMLLDSRGAMWGVFAGTITDARPLAWAAQFAGFQLAHATEAQLRSPATVRTRWTRGMPEASILAVQATLTGTKTVVRRARYLATDPTGDHPDDLFIRTRVSETPDAVATLAAANSVKRAGVVLDYAAVSGEDWQQVVDDNATWTSLVARYATWQDVINEPLA